MVLGSAADELLATEISLYFCRTRGMKGEGFVSLFPKLPPTNCMHPAH